MTLRSACWTPSPPTSRVPDYPDDLEEIVLHALAKSPDDRYQTARHFADALRDWLAGGGR